MKTILSRILCSNNNDSNNNKVSKNNNNNIISSANRYTSERASNKQTGFYFEIDNMTRFSAGHQKINKGLHKPNLNLTKSTAQMFIIFPTPSNIPTEYANEISQKI